MDSDLKNSNNIFGVNDTYDYNKTTEDNYCTNKIEYVGRYSELRKILDYTYHKHYTPERQLLQDKLMALFNSTVVRDMNTGQLCERPDVNWIVFTAGPMGAGKSHTLVNLSSKDLFPLESFVRVDPDSLRELLPETKEYIRLNAATAGNCTQKEVGYLAEILTLYALQQGKNVLVDGSLRDSEWYRKYIQALRTQYNQIKVAILHVTASEKTIFARCKKREAVTGRHVPESIIKDTMKQLPCSIYALAPYVDTVVTIENEDAEKNEDGSVSHSLPRLIDSVAVKYYMNNIELCSSSSSGLSASASDSVSGSDSDLQNAQNIENLERIEIMPDNSDRSEVNVNPGPDRILPRSLQNSPHTIEEFMNLFRMNCKLPSPSKVRNRSRSLETVTVSNNINSKRSSVRFIAPSRETSEEKTGKTQKPDEKPDKTGDVDHDGDRDSNGNEPTLVRSFSTARRVAKS